MEAPCATGLAVRFCRDGGYDGPLPEFNVGHIADNRRMLSSASRKTGENRIIRMEMQGEGSNPPFRFIPIVSLRRYEGVR
ncbi:MAG: hypothetical protein WAW52_02455 [Methanothrix sp.]